MKLGTIMTAAGIGLLAGAALTLTMPDQVEQCRCAMGRAMRRMEQTIDC